MVIKISSGLPTTSLPQGSCPPLLNMYCGAGLRPNHLCIPSTQEWPAGTRNSMCTGTLEGRVSSSVSKSHSNMAGLLSVFLYSIQGGRHVPFRCLLSLPVLYTGQHGGVHLQPAWRFLSASSRYDELVYWRRLFPCENDQHVHFHSSCNENILSPFFYKMTHVGALSRALYDRDQHSPETSPFWSNCGLPLT